jgi:hypothetical protein
MFHSFRHGKVSVKMQKIGLKKSFLASWKGPYPFIVTRKGMLGTK